MGDPTPPAQATAPWFDARVAHEDGLLHRRHHAAARGVAEGRGGHDHLGQRIGQLAFGHHRTVRAVRQQAQIDRLVRELVELRDRAAAAEPGGVRSLRDELPPHY